MRLPTLSIDQKKLVGSEDAKTKEWLVTNSLGGYASSTVLGINTRKYHGLLVAALRQSGDRTVCLAKLDEEVHIDNRILKFGTNEFYGQFFPKGYQYLQRFSVSPFPTYNYRTNDFELEKTIFMPRGENSIIVFYRATNQTPESVGFRVFPLMTCRHFHSVVDRRKNPLSFNQRDGAKEVHLTFNNPKATVIVKNYGGNFVREANWVERLYYREEHNRGESCTDDCYQPGYFEVVIAPQREHHFAVVATASRVAKAAKQSFERFGTSFQGFRNLFEQELKRRQENLATFYDFHKGVPKSEWLSWAFLATDAFITQQTGNKKSIIAGYFWFESWGRDTFISFPGLMLVTGRYEDAKKVLLDYIGYCKKGLIPNFVQDRLGRPSYNTVDATLWYINAVLQYLKYTGDKIFVYSKLWESLKAIIEKHEKGTDFGIRLDRDGLLTHGPQLTWMDAEFDGKAATPRGGKAVEIQALWYNALKTVELLANLFKEQSLAEKYASMASQTQESFKEKFWNHKKNCLFDVLGRLGGDPSVRPNQIIVGALDFMILDRHRAERVIDKVFQELLTPFGLRTLSRDDSKYKGSYVGDRNSRDSAYHNGTVWAWLQGSFTTAFLKTKGCSESNRQYAFRNFIWPLFNSQLSKGGLGHISEVFDGDWPHASRGCIAQAWSLAEPLRAYMEDVMQVRPKYEKFLLGT